MDDTNRSLRILIVDDNEELRTMLGEILERLGHTVQVVRELQSARLPLDPKIRPQPTPRWKRRRR